MKRIIPSRPVTAQATGSRPAASQAQPPGYSREPDPDAEPAFVPAPGPVLKGRGTAVVIGHRFNRVDRTAPEAAEAVVARPLRSPDVGRGIGKRSGSGGGSAGGGWADKGGEGKGGEGADDEGADDDSDDDLAPFATEVRFEQARRIIATNDSPDVPFSQSINPYRGCEHGCIYCFARPTHAYLDLSPGLDFERILIAKANAAERFRAQLARPGYRCSAVALGAATDPYQPIERRLGITRAVVEVAAECQHPVWVVTKSALVERDLDLLGPMAAQRLAAVMVTLTTLDPDVARRLEPRASAPHRRLRTIETLARAGVPVAVSVGPVIPFINDADLEKIIAAAAQAGARSVHYTVIRLPWEVAPLFEQWLLDHYPDRAGRVMARIRELRGGQRNDPRFGSRMRGEGVLAQLIRARVEKAARRHGLDRRSLDLDHSRFRPPPPRPPADDNANLSLF